MITTSKLETLLHGFVDRQDGTILSLSTNLIWQQEGPEKGYNWQQAKEYCKSLSLGGYTDWRLPTKEELESLINKRHRPTICPVFQCYDHWYWSSTSGAGGPDGAWGVDFGDGGVVGNGKGSGNYVRAVRSGP